MPPIRRYHRVFVWLLFCFVGPWIGHSTELWAQGPTRPLPQPLPGASLDNRPGQLPVGSESSVTPLPADAPSILVGDVRDLDLNTALRLAGVENPEVNLARQRVVEAVAFRQFAAAQILPTINLGTNYDSHTGNLQQSNGNILSVNRSAVYVGAGANAIAAGTVNIPGIFLGGNIAQGLFAFLTTKQVIIQRQFATTAIRNQVFLQVALAYSELIRAEGLRAIEIQARDEAREVARLTGAFAQTGQGRKADADRAATELARRIGEVYAAEGLILTSSAELSRVLNLDPSIRLHPTDAYVVPLPIVPDPQPLCELIALALLRRPELGERRAVIREAFLSLEGAKVLPFSPTVLIGFSAGGFGGGSNLVKPVFGSFNSRSDFDAIAYWTIQNMGVGNVALIKTAKARLGATRFQEIAVLNQIRAEVASSYARTHARFGQIGTTEAAVRSGLRGFKEDFDLTREQGLRTVLPIELLNNFRLLNQARREYLDAIVDYNRAQFELYVALGQPPADSLARVVPSSGVAPSDIPGGPRAPKVIDNPADRGAEASSPKAATPGEASNSSGVRR